MKFYNEIVNPETGSKIKFVFNIGDETKSLVKAITSNAETRTITYYARNIGEIKSEWLFNFYKKFINQEDVFDSNWNKNYFRKVKLSVFDNMVKLIGDDNMNSEFKIANESTQTVEQGIPLIISYFGDSFSTTIKYYNGAQLKTANCSNSDYDKFINDINLFIDNKFYNFHGKHIPNNYGYSSYVFNDKALSKVDGAIVDSLPREDKLIISCNKDNLFYTKISYYKNNVLKHTNVFNSNYNEFMDKIDSFLDSEYITTTGKSIPNNYGYNGYVFDNIALTRAKTIAKSNYNDMFKLEIVPTESIDNFNIIKPKAESYMDKIKAKAKLNHNPTPEVEVTPVETEVTKPSDENNDYNFELRMNIARYPKHIQARIQETGHRYLEIDKPKPGFTNCHIVPYSSCIMFRNMANYEDDLDKALEYEIMACSNDNIISLPHKMYNVIKAPIINICKDLSIKDDYGSKYIPKDKIPEYLIKVLLAFNEICNTKWAYDNDYHNYLKEYALKTLDYLLRFSDDAGVKVLANVLYNDLADMDDGSVIYDSIKNLVWYIQLNHL